MKALVFDDVTVVDVERGQLLPAQRVVIQGNHIQAVGNSGAVPAPHGAQVVDARGKYLIPGLWDMHVHPNEMANAFYPLFVANGITGIRDAHSSVPLDTLARWWREILAGTRVGPPRQLLAGGPLNTLDPDEAQRLVDSLKAHGANFLKVYPFSYALAAAARRTGLPFGGHVVADSAPSQGEPLPQQLTSDQLLQFMNSGKPISAIEASDSGISIEDHLVSAGDLHRRCLGPAATLDQCRSVAEHFQRNNTWWTPTLLVALPTAAGNTSAAGADAVSWTTGPDLAKRFGAFLESFWADSGFAGGRLRDSLQSTLRSRLAPGAADSLGGLSLVERVGMPILAGTDMVSGCEGIRHYLGGFSLHVELALLAAEGLTPWEALQAATLNPARLIHGTDSLGTVAPGKLADVVLLDANPLADIANTTTVEGVVANGHYYDRATLDQLLGQARAMLRGKC